MNAPSLILWDIDGTLVSTDRGGERAILKALLDLHGIDAHPKLPVDLRGRTDTSIVRDLFAHLNLGDDPELHRSFLDQYLANLPLTLPQGSPFLQPGVPAVLEKVREHPEIHQALLTGNLRRGAEIKLTHFDIWKYFEFGAFADDSPIRNELGPFALKRARDFLGIDFAPERVWIIGDTPHDVACGKIIGAKTIAVATGAFTVAELEACTPTHTLVNLSDTDKLVELILA